MEGENRPTRAMRRSIAGPARLLRGSQSELGVVAALLVVAVLVALLSVGGPIWDVLISGRTLFN